MVAAKLDIVLTLELVASICLNKIAYWNDSQILSLNPDLVSVLPFQPILPIQQSAAPGHLIGNAAMSRVDDEFRAKVPFPELTAKKFFHLLFLTQRPTI